MFQGILASIDRLDEIYPGLFLSGAGAAGNSEILKSRGITHVLQVAYEFRNERESDGIIRRVIEAEDDTDFDLGAHFNEACDFIDEEIGRASCRERV